MPATANDATWRFCPGSATYKGTKITINGIPSKLLQALVESNTPLAEHNLIEAGWGHDAEVEPKTLKNKVSAIRRTLQKKLGLTKDQDPIPVVDRGRNLAWTIADFLR